MKKTTKIVLLSAFGLALIAISVYAIGIFAIFAVNPGPFGYTNNCQEFAINNTLPQDFGINPAVPGKMMINGTMIYPTTAPFNGTIKDQCTPSGLLAEAVCGKFVFTTLPNGTFTNFPQYAGVVSINCSVDTNLTFSKCKTNPQGAGYCG